MTSWRDDCSRSVVFHLRFISREAWRHERQAGRSHHVSSTVRRQTCASSFRGTPPKAAVFKSILMSQGALCYVVVTTSCQRPLNSDPPGPCVTRRLSCLLAFQFFQLFACPSVGSSHHRFARYGRDAGTGRACGGERLIVGKRRGPVRERQVARQSARGWPRSVTRPVLIAAIRARRNASPKSDRLMCHIGEVKCQKAYIVFYGAH